MIPAWSCSGVSGLAAAVGAALPAALSCLLAAELLDPLARPRPRRRPFRSLLAWPFRAAPVLAVFGVLLLCCARPAAAAAVSVVLLLAAVVGSNAKRRILGEPLCFTDLALGREMLRHPGFYLGAVSFPLRILLPFTLLLIPVLLVLGASPALPPRCVGLLLLLLAALAAPLSRSGPWRALVRVPVLDRDVSRHGLLATLLLYPLRLRSAPPLLPAPVPPRPPPCVPSPSPPLVLVVQCESFADPAVLPLPPGIHPPSLPALDAARRRAHRFGRLHAPGFGAYTMRTEAGVLFGREEAELGFRRFDPFLLAGAAERAGALPHRLRAAGAAGGACFVHPHPLGFYDRDRLMPTLGFDRLLGPAAFPGAPRRGPHVSDAALGDLLLRLLDAPPPGPALIYAVTIENHGPWRPQRLPHAPDGLSAWLDHLREGDRLLERLVERLDRGDRSAVLCFFGDHRPSIPGHLRPGPDRDTPFVILRFPADPAAPAPVPEDLTPAALHHAILSAVLVPGTDAVPHPNHGTGTGAACSSGAPPP